VTAMSEIEQILATNEGDLQPAVEPLRAPGVLGTVQKVVEQIIINLGWVIGGLSLAVLVSVLTVSVLDRFIFKIGFAWPEEIGRLSLEWLTFTGATIAAAQGRHFFVSFSDKPSAEPSLARLIVSGCVFALGIFLVYQGFAMADIVSGQTLSSIDISVLWVYTPFLIFTCCVVVLELFNFIAIASALFTRSSQSA
jgi:TRAP-type C4-dicarboxylate transport system permease small subunit